MTTEISHSFEPILCPAIRARMGDRWYYLATLTFAEIARAVQPVPQLPADAKLKMWIQRELRPERTAQISAYIKMQKQRFFNSLVLGMFGGEPEWQPVALDANLTVKELKLDERTQNSFGMIRFSGNENIFAIDGQHRVEGIRQAVKTDLKIINEEQSVIFISHHETSSGRERTRRVFATLNTYARPISDRETVVISEDNAFAIATRRLVDGYPGLGMQFVPLLASPNIPASEKTSITSVVGLYQLTQFLSPLGIRRKKKRFKDGPADPEVVETIYKSTAAFWDALKKNIAPIKKVCNSKPSEKVAGEYRHASGGNLLFRPIGMQAFARAAQVLVDRGSTVDNAVAKLAKAPLELDHELWREVLWRRETKTMLNKYVRLALNVLLHKAGERPETKNYSVLMEYKRITGRDYPDKASRA